MFKPSQVKTKKIQLQLNEGDCSYRTWDVVQILSLTCLGKLQEPVAYVPPKRKNVIKD